MISMYISAGFAAGIVAWFILVMMLYMISLGCMDAEPKDYVIGCLIFAVTGAAAGYLYFFWKVYPLVQTVIGS